MELRRWMDDIMRTRTALVLFLTGIALGAMMVFAVGARAGEIESKTIKADGKEETRKDFKWRELGAGLDEAEADDKPLLVDVYTNWCGWCKKMDKTTYANKEVQAYIEQAFVPVKMNAESRERTSYAGDEYSYRQIARGFQIRSYPTTLFLEADGKHITSVPGYLKVEQFLPVLQYIGDGHYKSKTYTEFKAERKQAE
jgi:thioredoxin-related protein